MRVGIYGGAFNPIHVGHLRAAIEAVETLGLDRLDLVPAARPPHKAGQAMLPFALRLELVRLAVADLPRLSASDIEARRPGPSYTRDTLAAYGQAAPDDEHWFLMGLTDLLCLPSWREGLTLGTLANLAVHAREGLDEGEIARFLSHDGAAMDAVATGRKGLWRFPDGRLLRFLPLPRLDISATDIRDRFRRGRSIRFLVPRAVEEALEARRDDIRAAWSA